MTSVAHLTDSRITEFAVKNLVSTPINADGFAVGDEVTFTNCYGIQFSGHKIIGFAEPIYKNSGTIYLDYDCFWFPVTVNEIKKQVTND